MRLPTIIYVMLSAAAAANPLPGLNEAGALVYIASEQLSVSISHEGASLHGVFTFQSRGMVKEAYMNQPVLMDIPIWFPEQNSEGSNVTNFWKAIKRDEVVMFTPETRDAFEKGLVLNVFSGNQLLDIKRFTILTSHDDRQRWAPRDWQQEPGFWCIVPRFLIPSCSALTQKPMTISWRQPLLHVLGKREFFYLPVFENLPAPTATADTNRYSITITAEPSCSVEVSNGNEKATVFPGQSRVFTPRHHQTIRAMVTARANKPHAANSRPGSSHTFGRPMGAAVADGER
jgi:hypothetical protein